MTITRRRHLVAATALVLSAGLAQAQERSPYQFSEGGTAYRRLAVKTPDGLTIAARDWGNPAGPEIVLIHGFTGAHTNFSGQTGSDLVKEFRIVSYDLRGHGGSGKPLDDPAVYTEGRRWGDELKAVIEAAGLKRPVLVGWSMGGVVIANYLKTYGDAGIAGINFVDAVLKRNPDFLTEASKKGNPAIGSTDLAARIEAIRKLPYNIYGQGAPEKIERQLIVSAMVPQPVVAAIMKGISLDADAALQAVKVPVLVTHGTADALINTRMAEWDKATMPHAVISLYDGVGHAPNDDAAPRFNAELAAFVRTANAR